MHRLTIDVVRISRHCCHRQHCQQHHGRVDDVDVVLPETLVTGEMPGEVRSWALTFYGICRCCAADDNKNNKEKN